MQGIPPATYVELHAGGFTSPLVVTQLIIALLGWIGAGRVFSLYINVLFPALLPLQDFEEFRDLSIGVGADVVVYVNGFELI